MEKVVIVTGAVGKLGPDIVRRFAATGASVVANYRKSSKVAEALAAEINKGPGKCFPYQADVRSFDEVKGMAEETLKKWKRIDVVVNAAGGPLSGLSKEKPLVALKEKPLLELSEEDWDLVIDTNLKGTFNCFRAMAPQMIKQHDGHFILISSLQGVKPTALTASYAAAKAGVLGLTKAAAIDLADYNIKVNAVLPGGESADSMKNSILKRFSTPRDLADFIVYLSGTDNISGQTFHVGNRIWV